MLLMVCSRAFHWGISTRWAVGLCGNTSLMRHESLAGFVSLRSVSLSGVAEFGLSGQTFTSAAYRGANADVWDGSHVYLKGQVENCITLHAPLHTAIRHDRTQTLSSCAKLMLYLPTFKIIIYIIASILFLCKNAVQKSRVSIFFITNNFERGLQSRAGRYISCEYRQ